MTKAKGPKDQGARTARARRAIYASVALVLWGLITHGTYAGSGDEPHYLAIAHSIAFDGDFDLSNNYGANEPLVGGGVLEFENHVRSGTGGVLRPVHDVGLPLLAAPIVRIAVPLTHVLVGALPESTMRRARLTPAVLYRQLLSLAMIAVGAALAGLLFDTFMRLGGTTRAAVATALLLVLSPPLLVMSVLFFTETVSAFICFVVFRRIAIVPAVGTRPWALTGIATGFLFLLHARNIGLVIPLAALVFVALRDRTRRTELTAFAGGLVAMIAARTALNVMFWGSLIASPHARLGGLGSVGGGVKEMGVRLAGVLVDQEYGLLIYAPIYVVAAGGFLALWKVRSNLFHQILIVCGVYVLLILLPITNVHGWAGGWSPPARFLTPIVPLLGIAVFAGLRHTGMVLLALVVAAQIAIDAYAWQHPKILWNDGDGRAAFCERTGERVCRALPSFAPYRK
jgi:hypothetical protein